MNQSKKKKALRKTSVGGKKKKELRKAWMKQEMQTTTTKKKRCTRTEASPSMVTPRPWAHAFTTTKSRWRDAWSWWNSLFFPPPSSAMLHSVFYQRKNACTQIQANTRTYTHTPIYVNIHTRTYTLKHSLSFASLYVYQKGHEGALSPPFIGEKKN